MHALIDSTLDTSAKIDARIAEVAASWMTPESEIRAQRQRDVIAEILSGSYPDYDDLRFNLACRELLTHDQDFDVLVKLAYYASSEPRTPNEAKTLAHAFGIIAFNILAFNAGQGDWDEEAMDALYDA